MSEYKWRTIVSRRVCGRDVNLAVTVLRQYRKFTTVQRTSSPWWVVWVIHTVIFTHFLTRNQAKILILKGLNRRRSTPWDWGIILIFVLVRSLIVLVEWNHNYSELCSEDVQSRNANTGTMDDIWCRPYYYMPMCPDFDAVTPWLKCIGDEI